MNWGFSYICDMDFEQEEFDGLMLPVHQTPVNIDILDKFPELGRYIEFKQHVPEKNNVIRYIVYFYDRKTPLSRIENILMRKSEAAKLAGFELENEKFPEYVEEILKCENHVVNAMIIRYLRISNNHKFAMLSTTIELYYRNLNNQLDGSKSATFKEAQAMEKTISSITDELLQMDKAQILTEDMYQMIDYDNLDLSPEDVAKRIKAGLPGVSYNPY